MGRVRTKTVKRAAKVLLQKHYIKLTNDFHINKRILSEVAKVPTKRLRNKIAGFATHLVKRIQKGPVKGISLKVQEEERERRLDWVPKESEIKTDKVAIDQETKAMLKKRFGDDFYAQVEGNLEVKEREVRKAHHRGGDRRRNNRGDNKERRGPRPNRENREQKPEGAQQQQEGAKQDAPVDSENTTKREGRRRGPREGQQE